MSYMIQECKFNPLCDVEEVVPELAPDISEMMTTHTVPASSSVETPYSNEDDIKKVGRYLRDKVDIAIAKMRLDASLASSAESQSPAASAGQTEKS